MPKEYIEDLSKRMDGAIHSLKHSLNGLRTGRANPSLLDPIRVDAYGDHMPITQLASITTPDARMISVQVWDASVASSVVKAIQESGLGLNPIGEGQVIRIPIPDLSEERRKELNKKAHEYAENCKIAVRNVRRDGNDHFKKLEKDKLISEDECRDFCDDVQKLTDDYVKKADAEVALKIKEIMSV